MLRDPQETRFYQKAADVLVSYYSTDDHPYAYQQLPAKVAEYMASGNAIVAADYPAVHELLNAGNSWLVEAAQRGALTNALKRQLKTLPNRRPAVRKRSALQAARGEALAEQLGTLLATLQGAAR